MIFGAIRTNLVRLLHIQPGNFVGASLETGAERRDDVIVIMCDFRRSNRKRGYGKAGPGR